MHRYRAEITLLETRRLGSPRERIADAFAENFLMPESGLNRRFTEFHRGAEKGITLADIVSLSNLYEVAVQALVLRLETLRRLPAGTWHRLVAEGLKVREAQRQLGIDANPPFEQLLPQRYVALAVEAYKKGELSEGQLARYLRVDRVSARLCVEEGLQGIHEESEGEFRQVEPDLAQPLGGR
jgi:Zn-dependent peptidase ImmA (M78 family)